MLRVDLILADVEYFLMGNALIEIFNYISRKKIAKACWERVKRLLGRN